MLLSDFIRESTARLSRLYPEQEARSIVSILCEERLGVSRHTHILDPQHTIPDDSLREEMLRLEDSEPIQYVLGECTFCGRRFKVGPSVLIPRPETETLVERAEALAQGRDGMRILDLCTGSGCIAWTLSKDIPGCRVTAVDISGEALETARGQFSSDSPVFLEADILGDIPAMDSFDILVSNPPYIMREEAAMMRPNVLRHEPHLALFVPDEDPLVFYRAIARWASELLRPQGYGIVEINESLWEQTAGLFEGHGFEILEIIKDFFGKNRDILFKKP